MGGHTYAAAFVMAMAHDYRVMNAVRGFASMNEAYFGAPIGDASLAVLQSKITDVLTLRSVVLEARKFDGPAALANGLVDRVVPSSPQAQTGQGQGKLANVGAVPAQVLQAAIELANELRPVSSTNVWGTNRKGTLASALEVLSTPQTSFAKEDQLSLCPEVVAQISGGSKL